MNLFLSAEEFMPIFFEGERKQARERGERELLPIFSLPALRGSCSKFVHINPRAQDISGGIIFSCGPHARRRPSPELFFCPSPEDPLGKAAGLNSKFAGVGGTGTLEVMRCQSLEPQALPESQ